MISDRSAAGAFVRYAEVDGDMHDSTLVLMTLDELPGLRKMFGRLPLKQLRRCIAVDGGSTDGTVEFLRDKNIPVHTQSRKGWGEAARVGAAAARTRSIVFFSPDGNNDPDDILHLLEALDEGKDLVIASRFLVESIHEEDGQILRLRARGCQAFTSIVNRRFRPSVEITDATNGFRAITKDAFQALALDAEGFELAYQMTIRALKLGLKIGEIPTFEAPRLAGSTHARSIPVGLHHLKVLLRELKDD